MASVEKRIGVSTLSVPELQITKPEGAKKTLKDLPHAVILKILAIADEPSTWRVCRSFRASIESFQYENTFVTESWKFRLSPLLGGWGRQLVVSLNKPNSSLRFLTIRTLEHQANLIAVSQRVDEVGEKIQAKWEEEEEAIEKRDPIEIAETLANEASELFKQFNRTSKLELVGLRIYIIPKEIICFTQLETLDLSHNPITRLVPQIGQLTQLKVLNLSNNRIRRLIPEIGRLRNLQQLFLNNNQIEDLIPAIGLLNNLRVLGLTNNRIKVLIPEIGQLGELEELRLTENSVTQLIPEIGNLTKLKSLILNGNPVKQIPSELSNMTRKIILGPSLRTFFIPRKVSIKSKF